MRRDARAYLWDVEHAAGRIAEFIARIDEARFRSDALIQSAVERQLEIIGEALNQLSSVDPEIAQNISQIRQAIGLRNVLVHGYTTVDAALIWNTVTNDVPDLRRDVTRLLEKLE